MGRFDRTSVIVTGGGRGMGRAIVLAFAREGADVVCVDIDEGSGKQVVVDAAGLPGRVVHQRADVTDPDACDAVVRRAIDEHGGVGVLSNNVGIQPPSTYCRLHELPLDVWDRVLAVNLRSAFLMCRSAIPAMLDGGGGVIVNTGSVQGLQSAANASAYAASKGGILSLTRALALDYAADGIRAVSISPGTIDTPLVGEAADALGRDVDELRDTWADCHPLGRVGQPEEVAALVLFLASNDAGFITGENVTIDGGMMAKGAWAQ